MWFVVAGLMVAVIVLASRKEGDSQSTGDVPPNALLPGTGASAVQSPATTGANPLSSQAGKLIASVTTRLPGSVKQPLPTFTVPPPASVDTSAPDKQLAAQGTTPTVQTTFNRNLRKF